MTTEISWVPAPQDARVAYQDGLMRIVQVDDCYHIQGGWNSGWEDICVPVKDYGSAVGIFHILQRDGE